MGLWCHLLGRNCGGAFDFICIVLHLLLTLIQLLFTSLSTFTLSVSAFSSINHVLIFSKKIHSLELAEVEVMKLFFLQFMINDIFAETNDQKYY